MNILLIDDEQSLRKSLRLALETMGHRIQEAGTGSQGRDLVAHHQFDVVFLDLRLGREQGLDVLPSLLQLAPGLAVIVITAYATIETAVEAMRSGAADYLPKPFTPGQVRVVLDRVQRLHRLQSHVEELEDQVRSVVPEADLQTRQPVMQQCLDIAFRAAATEATILLRGESGTGKGVLARAIHARSSRAAAPFVTVHCPSLSTELLETELFGHVRGAFTGAVQDAVGKVSAAEGGTLFLDEIGDLPLTLQPKLLRLLQERRYERVGEPVTRSSDVRIIAATNHNLEEAVAKGTFREDLFYRLNVIDVTLPSLRQRPEDILPLATHLLHFFARQSGKQISQFTEEARNALRQTSVAGQRARAAKCGRTGRDSRSRPRGRTRRSARPSRRDGPPQHAGNRQLGHPRTARGRAYSTRARANSDDGRSGDGARNRPQHALSQTQTLRSLSVP